MRLGARLPASPACERSGAASHFAGLDGVPALLLAVSGGPDSMALMIMMARWAGRLAAPPKLHVASVDHGLRHESRSEAARVAAAAARLGLPHATLHWTGAKPKTRIQERARAARYALLVDHARAIGAGHVLTGHHADDQAETVLMRLARGSGLAGLAGMRRESPLAQDVTLVRPLLDLSKADLVALCRAEHVDVVDDPSNRDPAYARSRLREKARLLDELGLDRARLAQLARRAARAEAALEAETDRIAALLSPRRRADAWTAPLAGRGDMQPEILLRLLRRAIADVAPSPGALRLERLERLTEAVAAAMRDGATHRATLGGARIVLAADAALTVTPAPARRRGLRSAAITRSSGICLD